MKRALPVLCCLGYFCVLVFLSRQHPFGTYATETDFYHLYAPDAARLSAGHFPENDFQGPGYPAILAAVTKLTGDIFSAGKWISILSGGLAAWLVYVLFARLFDYRVGLSAALLLMVGVEIPEFSFSATTDIYFLMLCLAALASFVSERLSVQGRIAAVAGLTGLAYLARYNGLFLLAAFLLAVTVGDIFKQSWKGRLRSSALLVAIFLLTTSPWLIANYRHHGSPFYNANYLNMATLFYPDLAGGSVMQDGTRRVREKFHSFGEVLSYEPRQAAGRYLTNLRDSFLRTLKAELISPLVAWVALIGVALALIERRSKAVLMLLTAAGLYFVLMGLNHWESRYYFFITAVYAGMAAAAVFRVFDLVQARGWLRHPAYVALPVTLLAGLWISSFGYAKNETRGFLASHPTEIAGARDFILRTHGSDQHGLKIVARKPHLPFMAHQEWVFFPQVQSLDELHAWLEKNPVDYIAVGVRELKERKALAALGNPKTAPPWLQAAWVNEKPLFVLYQPRLSQGDKSALAESQSSR